MGKWVILVALLLGSFKSWANDREPWQGEDCEKLGAASAHLVFLSGKSLEEAGKLKEAGKKKQADEKFAGAMYLSNLAANYAKTFDVFCK